MSMLSFPYPPEAWLAMSSKIMHRQFPATTSSLEPTRRFVELATATLGVAPEIVEDLCLATSELVSNAAEHGPKGHVELDVEVSDHDVSLTVASKTSEPQGKSTLPPVEEWSLSAPQERYGRGLAIVRTIMDDVVVQETDGELRVTCRRRRLAA